MPQTDNINDLLEIPWFLDRRESNPRLEEAKKLWAKLALEYKEKIIVPTSPQQPPLSSWERKAKTLRDKRNRKICVTRVLKQLFLSLTEVAGQTKKNTISGRKLKSAFLQIEDVINGTLLPTDYERGIRVLVKDGTIKKQGRSYSKGRTGRYAK